LNRSTPRVALVGAAGHGTHHLRTISRLAAAGRVELAALCDPRPVLEPPAGVPVFPDHRAMLDQVRPDIAVVSTPPHTHLPIALDLVAAGADLLLEKPPVATLAEHETLAAALADAGRVAQIGFQAQGSHAVATLRHSIAEKRLGEVRGIAAAGTWIRPDSYYARSAWAGRRRHEGRPVLDGALVNPFAHTLMLGLALVTPAVPVSIELERYRCREIEVEDTACLRVHFDTGPALLVAVTLCAPTAREGDIVVHGTEASAVLEYPTDRLAFTPPGAARPGGAAESPPAGRADLLENLLDHRRDPAAVPLLVPLEATRTFTILAEAVVAAPRPVRVPASSTREHGTGPARTVELTGVDAAVTAAAGRLAMFHESGAAWARPAITVPVGTPPSGSLRFADPS